MANSELPPITNATALQLSDTFYIVQSGNSREASFTQVIAFVESAAATFTNKTIDGDNNTISNLAIGAEVSGSSTALSDTADITYNADFTSLANVLAIDQSLISGATPTFTTTNFTDASNKRFMSDAQETVLDSVETNADVTDTANVTAAGALMDSEVDADIKTLTLPASVTIGAYHSFLNTANETAFHQAVNLEPGVDVQDYDADTLKADTDDTLTAGFAATGVSDGTKSSGTYTPAAAGGNYKEIINGGAFTLAPMTLEGNVTIEMTNNGSAGTMTTSGFDIVTGDTLDTTDTNVFLLYLTVIDTSSHLHVTALQ